MGGVDWSLLISLVTASLRYPTAQQFQVQAQFIADKYVAENYMRLPVQKAGTYSWTAVLCEHGSVLRVSVPSRGDAGDIGYSCIANTSFFNEGTAVGAKRRW